MHLALDADQIALVDVATTLLQKYSSAEQVRAAEPAGFDAQLWRALVELGVPGLAVGPDAASSVHLAALGESLGRALATVPFPESIVGASVLHEQHPLGEAVARGEEIVAFAPRPAQHGSARLVPGAAVASHAIVYDGDRLLLVPTAGAARPRSTLAPLAVASVDCSAGEVLSTGSAAAAAHATALAQWQRLTASVLVGIAAASLDVGVEYVKARKQFGVPIGSFQAVQHPLADVATEVDGARLLTYKAAWATDEGRERSAAWSAMAYLFAATTAVKAAAASLHFHGGYGYTVEYDIQLYVRRAKALQLIAGDPEAGVDRLADLLYGPPSGAVLR